ncbi:aquaporin [Sandarakinorhabdus oryzae]|uniref:aquaporin n=1 Tax=Sandarakinorhabdus oryzae TaxID=2675220 RepID=UPI0012E1788A|nr:aquaporin [Sandarakinorhabdus oryzae]
MRGLWAEAVGTFFLFATVIGSGVLAQQLGSGEVLLGVLVVTLATVMMLQLLVTMLGPVSGAQFNPVVSLVLRLRGQSSWGAMLVMVAVQIAAGIAAVLCVHAMFGLPILQVATNARGGPGLMLGEFVATFGLILTVLLTGRHAPHAGATSVALYIGAAILFTSSTCFANPAITIARALSDTFTGIAPAHVPGFIAAQFAGGLSAHWLERVLYPEG